MQANDWCHPQGLTLEDIKAAAVCRITGGGNQGDCQYFLAAQPACYHQLVSAAQEVASLRPHQYPPTAAGQYAETIRSPTTVVPSLSGCGGAGHISHHHESGCESSRLAELQRQQLELDARRNAIHQQAVASLQHTCQGYTSEPILAAHSPVLHANMAASHAAAGEFLAAQVAQGKGDLREQLVPFRKKRDHPKSAKKILESWYIANADSLGRAYCSKADRSRLAADCDLLPKQVSTWISNRRNRSGKDEE